MFGRPRPARLLLLLLVLAAVGAWFLQRAIAQHVESRLQAAGFATTGVGFSWWGPLRVEGAARSLPGGARLAVETVELRWSLRGGLDPRSHLAGVELRGARVTRAPLALVWRELDLDVTTWTRGTGGERVELRQHPGDGAVTATRTGGVVALGVAGLDLAAAEMQWNGETVMTPGVWSGRATFPVSGGGPFESEGTLHAESVGVTAPPPLQAEAGIGVPTAMDVEWKLRGGAEILEVERFGVRLSGLEIGGHAVVRGAMRDADVAVQARCELGAAFRTAGLALPLSGLRDGRLGAAVLDLTVRGPLDDPTALVVAPRLRFTPAKEVVQALSYLREPFVHRPPDSPGVVVDVRDGAPDFISIEAVPPLFQKALVISEDAGFRGHPGIDLTEILAAWVANGGGGRIRGASTITQQLVKNVFLSSERTYGRKLKEAALALMVDAVLSKPRVLEIYVNVIEWGPGLHGLLPAARHYFGKAPAELTPKETAFLVCLIPSPVRYHQAHEAGKLGPGMEQLVRNLLAKLRSVDAISEEEYQQALGEELQFAPEADPTSAGA